jgi:hypothetical protein
MAWNPFKRKEQTRALEYNVPEKVFIEREGPYYEWSEQPPASLQWGVQNLLSGFYGSQNYIELYYSVPEVFAPVHEIAKRVSDANWQLCKEWNDEVDYKDEDFNRLFTQPNPLDSIKDLIYNAVCYEILTGKQLFHFNQPKTLIQEYKSIISWSNLPTQNVWIDMKKNVDRYTATDMRDFINGYELTENGGKRKFTPEEILPLLNLDLRNSVDLNCTKSYLCGADKAIRNLIPVYEARGVIYIKRGAMGMWVSSKGDASGKIALTHTEKKNLAADINSMYGVQGGKATIGFTDQPVDFIKTSMSIAEMQPFDETLADATAIYTVLRVPKHLIPSKDQSTYANAAADMKSFYSNVIIPWAKRYAVSLTNYMRLKDSRRYINPDFNHVDELQENRQEKAAYQKLEGDTYLQRWQNGACSLNEWIVANDGNRVAGNPLYEKKTLEMTPEELELLKAALNLKAIAAPVDNNKPDENGTDATTKN